MIELTEEQRQAIARQPELPVRVIDPETKKEFVLVKAEWFDSQLADQGETAAHTESNSTPPVDPLIMSAMRAFWRELPELLGSWRNRGRWVAYHGEQRVGITRRMNVLIAECVRLGVNPHDVYYATIAPLRDPPWGPDEIDIFPLIECDDEPSSR